MNLQAILTVRIRMNFISFFRLRDTFGQTIVILTHDRQLAGMSDRILQIKDGMMVQE